MIQNNIIGVVGSGNMARAIIAGLISSGAVAAKQIVVSGRTLSKLASMQKAFGVNITSDSAKCIVESDVVILAVKPQDFATVARTIRQHLRPSHILVSLMAGISIADIQRTTGAQKVVKAMPTLAVSHCKGSLAWSHSPQLDMVDIKKLRFLFALLGKELLLDNDRMVDLSATISGSGLAYFYLMVELLVRNGERLGLSAEVSELLAKQALIGAASLLEEDGRNLEDRITEIAPKGGMTEKAISILRNGLIPVLAGAVDRAADRALEISKASERLT